MGQPSSSDCPMTPLIILIPAIKVATSKILSLLLIRRPVILPNLFHHQEMSAFVICHVAQTQCTQVWPDVTRWGSMYVGGLSPSGPIKPKQQRLTASHTGGPGTSWQVGRYVLHHQVCCLLKVARVGGWWGAARLIPTRHAPHCTGRKGHTSTPAVPQQTRKQHGHPLRAHQVGYQ